MRTSLALAGLVLLRAALAAAPVPAGGPPPSPQQRRQLEADALHYAQQMLTVSAQVSAGYVRPVARAELLETAVAGLYQAARRPLPPGLRADVARLDGDEAVLAFLKNARERLGAVEAFGDKRDVLVSCRAMLRALDPHSDVVTAEDGRPQPWGDAPVGLGLEVKEGPGAGSHRVVRVLPGGPAQKAGLRPGDEISHIDGKPLKGMTGTQVAGVLPGREAVPQTLLRDDLVIDQVVPPASVKLTVRRPGKEPWAVKLEQQDGRPESVFGVRRHDDNSWDFLLDRKHKLAYARVETLNRGAAAELAQVVGRLADEGARGLVLDLRWSPGGFLDEALGMAGLFLDDGVITSVRGRDREAARYHNTQPRRFLKLPLVVLVNGQTSGASELVAAALQDAKRAAVAGQRSLGKGSVQTALYVDVPGGSVKMTTGEFVRAGGKGLHRRPDSGPRDEWGVTPDRGLGLPLSPSLARELRGWHERQVLRPGGDLQIQPLDDPASDPQRELALGHLRDRVGK